jgi:hypothetical protein
VVPGAGSVRSVTASTATGGAASIVPHSGQYIAPTSTAAAQWPQGWYRIIR